VLGFPIRTSADQCLVDGYPQLFAVTHVLHRFLAPRHPPLALCSLEEQRCSCLLCSSQRAAKRGRYARRLPDDMRHWQSRIVRGTPWAAGAGAPCRSPRSVDPMGRLPQNGREDKVCRAGMPRGRILRLTCHCDCTHQCTNWEWFEPGRTNAYQRLNCSP